MSTLFNFQAPALPLPGRDYDDGQQRELLRALRLYFNRLDGDLTTLANPLGEANLNRPTALYFSTVDQTAAVINTAYAISFENTYFQNGMTINGGSSTQITVERAGIYNFQFSGQLLSKNSSAKTAQIWIRRDGTDIGYSAHAYTDDQNNGYLEVNWNFNIDLDADGYIEIMWATTDTGLKFDSVAPSAPYPGIPSAVMAVNFISNLDGFSIAAAP
jgi:hypothetical protein